MFGNYNNGYGYNQNNFMYNQPQYITKQVSSIEEARAYIIDGINTYLFVDLQSSKIYMKRLGNNGISEFYVFTAEQSSNVNPLEQINMRLSNIEKRLGGYTNVSTNESNESNGTAVNKSNAK